MPSFDRSFLDFLLLLFRAGMRDNMRVICRKLLSKMYERGALKLFDSVGSEGIIFLLFFLQGWEPDTRI